MLGERAKKIIISLNRNHRSISVVEAQCFACERRSKVLKFRSVDMKFMFQVITFAFVHQN
jgi:hypothetical protein